MPLRCEVWQNGSRGWAWAVLDSGETLRRGRCETWLQAYRAGWASLRRLEATR